MITCALIASAVIALVLVVLVQGKWTSRDSWFATVFASAVMAMVIDHLRQSHQLADAQAIFRRRRHQRSSTRLWGSKASMSLAINKLAERSETSVRPRRRGYSASWILAMMIDGSIFLSRISVTSRASSFDNRKAS